MRFTGMLEIIRVDAYASISKYEEAIKELNYVQTYFPDSAAIDFKKA